MTAPDHDELATELRRVAADEFPGLGFNEASPLSIAAAVGNDDVSAVWWTIEGRHGEQAATLASHGPTFLGFFATGQPVKLEVMSFFSGGAWHHTWDRLHALHQIGVRAVGRPVLR